MISNDDVKKRVKTKDQFYDACVANGYFLPSKASSLCSAKFLMEIYSGKVNVPKTS